MVFENLVDSNDPNIDFNTKNIVKRANTIWTIENFHTFKSLFVPCANMFCKSVNLCQKCLERKLTVENNSTFKFEVDSKVKCSLAIYPNDLYDLASDYASLFLRFEELSCLKITILCKFSILNADEKEEYKSVTDVEKFDENDKSYHLLKFISINDLLGNGNIHLPSDGLKVCFEMFYLCDDVNTSGVSETTPIDKNLNKLLQDMRRMLDSSEFYDCIIKVGNHKINVHKCMLATRSEVFRSTLKKKLTAFQSNTLEMSGFRLEVVKEMVNYLYTGRSPKIDEMAIEMLEIAERYKLEGLKMISTESLLNGLNVENVCEYLEKSEIYSTEILKEFCIRYIYLNAEEVIRSEKWSRIVNFYPLLLARIFNVAVHIE